MKKRSRIIAITVVVVLQIVFFAVWYGVESDVFAKPTQKILVKSQPLDPRDLLSGQYIRLTYNFSTLWGTWDPEKKETVRPAWAAQLNGDAKGIWMVLHEVDGFYEPKIALSEKPTDISVGEVVIKGRKDHNNRINYDIERYFVPEGTPNPRQEEAITVELNIYGNGLAKINKVYVSGKEWP